MLLQYRRVNASRAEVSVEGTPDVVRALRFRALDSWRGICALCVAMLHFPNAGFIHSSAVIQNAGRFVDFFFVLSGFVIAYAFRNQLEAGGWPSFVIRRIGRLWPLHVAVLGVLIAIAFAASAAGLHISGENYWAIPANLTMTQAWGYLDYWSWNGPSWSISTEMFAYLLFAFLAWMARGRALDVACIAVLVGSYILVAYIAPEGFESTVTFAVPRCLFGFMAGVLTHSYWRTGALRPRGDLAAVIVTFLAVAFLPQALSGLLAPVFAWAILVFASDEGWISRILHKPFPQMLGKVSYSIYMTHYVLSFLIIKAVDTLTGATAKVGEERAVVAQWWVCDALTLAFLALVIAVSCMTYRWIEQPGRKWFNQRAEPVPAAW
jgi:peptidoglycan/LPS O-acetylase OafA/YrhL